MSRQRFIHPEIFESEDFLSLPHGARLLFIAMFTLADDHGRGRGGHSHLAGAAFPGEIVPIQDWIGAVTSRKMARFYEVNGSIYYDLPTWVKWQKPKYVAASKIPEFAPRKVRAKPGTNLGQIGPESGTNPDTGSNRVVIGRGGEGRGGDPPSEGSAEPETAPASAPPHGPVFPVTGPPGDWPLPPDLDAELRTAYPTLDAETVYREARAWLVANPTRRKTRRGMGRFLLFQFQRAQNGSAAGRTGRRRSIFDPSRKLGEF